MGWVEIVVLLSEMMFPVDAKITVSGDGTEFQDGFGAVEAPAGSADVEAVGDE
jgi:hypothetical protein